MSTHYIPFLKIKKKIILDYHKSTTMGSVSETQERVRNSRGKRATNVRATEVPLGTFIQTSLLFPETHDDSSFSHSRVTWVWISNAFTVYKCDKHHSLMTATDYTKFELT